MVYIYNLPVFYPVLFILVVCISNSKVQPKPQDIIFSEHEHVVTTRRPEIPTKTKTPPTTIFHPDQELPNKLQNCQRFCVVLDLCPNLYDLLKRPTRENVKVLKYASCGFTASGDPLVWCEDFVCDPLKLQALNYSRQGVLHNGINSNKRENLQQHQMQQRQVLSINNLPSDVAFTERSDLQLPPFISTRSALASPKIDTNGNNRNLVTLTAAPKNLVTTTPKAGANTGSTFDSSVKFPGEESTDSGNLENQVISGINSADCGIAFPSRISGGEAAAKGEFPWIVAISVYAPGAPKVICGGALISDSWVITAAHCVADSAHNLRNISHVRVGAHNISNDREEDAENIGIKRILFHDQFRERPVVKNDIALLQLERSVNPSTIVGSICLPNGTESLSELYGANTVTTIAGWGSDGVKSNYSILQKVNVPLVDGDICKRIFYRIRVRVITDVQVCAGELKKDSCKGDSGGPLMIEVNDRTMLIGIISYGTTKCDGSLPGVYTKVTSYMDWIKETIAKYSN